MPKIVRIIFFLVLAACAGRKMTYAETLEPWLGQSEERLQQSWGYPYKTFYLTPSRKIITYLKFSTRPIDGDTEPYSYEVWYPAISIPDFGFPNQPQSSDYYCKTSFTIQNGIVIDYSFNGDDCVVSY